MWFENQDCASLSGQVKWTLSLCRSAPLCLLTSADYSKIQVFSYLFFAAKKASVTSALVLFISASPSALWSHSPLLLRQSEMHAISLELQMAFIRCFLPSTVLLRQLQWSSVDVELEQGGYTTFSKAGKSFILFHRHKG